MPEDPSSRSGHHTLAPEGTQERVRQTALAKFAGAAAELQGRSRCDRQQIDTGLTRVAVIQLCEDEHGQPVDILDGLNALGGELANVLPGDRRVRADVDDIMPRVAGASEVVDDLRDHALGDVGLAEPHLVGNQKPGGGIPVGEHPLERPAGSSPLEVLQVVQHRIDVDALFSHRSTTPSIATP